MEHSADHWFHGYCICIKRCCTEQLGHGTIRCIDADCPCERVEITDKILHG